MDAVAYERRMGRWSRLAARAFLSWLAVPEGARWLDVGCGTGALSDVILRLAAPRSVKGIDVWASGVRFARERIADPRAAFEVGDAQALAEETGAFDAAVSGLVLHFVAEPARAMAEMARVIRPGGTAAVYVWDFADKMEMFRRFWDEAAALDPKAAALDPARQFPVLGRGELTALLAGPGLRRVEVREIEVAMRFRDFDDYWLPFVDGQGSAPDYLRSLPAEAAARLSDRLRARLPAAADGSIGLVARAWAARGVR